MGYFTVAGVLVTSQWLEHGLLLGYFTVARVWVTSQWLELGLLLGYFTVAGVWVTSQWLEHGLRYSGWSMGFCTVAVGSDVQLKPFVCFGFLS